MTVGHDELFDEYLTGFIVGHANTLMNGQRKDGGTKTVILHLPSQ